ncbi:MAG: hypothetical protein AAF212_06215 [Verrucomicrobiota bacterium]
MGEKPIIPIPDRLQIFHDRDKLVIRRKWFGLQVLFLIPFTLFWNGFLIFWFYRAFTDGQSTMAAFGSIHGLVGLGLIYFLICNFANATDISVDPNHVVVKIHPFPFPGGKKIRTSDITQLYCDKRITRHKNGTSVSYTVKIIDQRGKYTKLVSGLREPEEAKFIESKIESILGIENQPVAGEI